ncbi:MAG: (d)CMP kinase [Lachnospiraceae bacterium]|nr:(d)CMP kinase [Lachnospiraceae bacterium]
MSFNVAIDGPAGAGKSTIAKKIAKQMGYIYIDTGAMYRAMALYFIQNGINAEESDKISTKCKEADITIQYQEGEQIVLLNGKNVNGLIRTEEVGKMASVSSVNKDVREKLVDLQQKLAATANVIMDGRDIGTCVLPNADVKIYLTASSYIRAKRRYEELMSKGERVEFDMIEKDIIERDHRDMTRELSPLKQAEDAILVDSSNMGIDEVVQKIISLCK